MFSRILVPLDGSALAEGAIPHAERFARIFGADIILLQVLEPTSYHENPKAVDPMSWQIRKAEADVYMQRIAAQMRDNLGETAATDGEEQKSRVTYCILEGKTAENIVDYAHAEGIDLVIISTHGSGGLSRWCMSSVTQKVLNRIYLHVLLVRSFIQSEMGQRGRYRRILLPFDSSRRAENSLAAGIALSQKQTTVSKMADAEQGVDGPSPETTTLVLATVIQPPEIPIPKPYPVEINLLSEQLMQVSRDAVHKYLDTMQERLQVKCETCVVESDSIGSTVQDLAAQESVDLVVLSAHGYAGQLTPYGTVTRNYMEHGTKHVLVIQDVRLSQVQPTAAEIAAEESGRRKA